MNSALIDDSLVKSKVPNRPDTGNKGTFGMTLIVAGSEYMTGAAVLATSAALRSGAGLVRLYSTDETLLPVKINCPCAMTAAFEETVPSTIRKAKSLMTKVTSVAIGPGIDENDKRYEAVLEFLILNAANLVIDAGAINIMAGNFMYWKDLLLNRTKNGLNPAILTPHIGEFKRLLGKDAQGKTVSELNTAAIKLSKESSCIIVLKNSETMICSEGGECYINQGANSGMAKGGSGDVLTGLMAGILSQGLEPLDAAISAVYIHSEVGRITSYEIGKRAMLPIDLLEYLPEAYERLGW